MSRSRPKNEQSAISRWKYRFQQFGKLTAAGWYASRWNSGDLRRGSGSMCRSIRGRCARFADEHAIRILCDSLAMTKELLLELQNDGYCILREHFSQRALKACREAFWPVLNEYLGAHREVPNRGPHRHFLRMPFTRPCFAEQFFFDDHVLRIVRYAMDDRVVADQMGLCCRNIQDLIHTHSNGNWRCSNSSSMDSASRLAKFNRHPTPASHYPVCAPLVRR